MGVGERELAEDTGLARSAYMSSESALRPELLWDVADDTEDTLLTLKDLEGDRGRGKQRWRDHPGGEAAGPPEVGLAKSGLTEQLTWTFWIRTANATGSWKRIWTWSWNRCNC